MKTLSSYRPLLSLVALLLVTSLLGACGGSTSGYGTADASGTISGQLSGLAPEPEFLDDQGNLIEAALAFLQCFAEVNNGDPSKLTGIEAALVKDKCSHFCEGELNLLLQEEPLPAVETLVSAMGPDEAVRVVKAVEAVCEEVEAPDSPIKSPESGDADALDNSVSAPAPALPATGSSGSSGSSGHSGR